MSGGPSPSDTANAGSVLPRIDWAVAAEAGARMVSPGPRISDAERAELVAHLRGAAARGVQVAAETARLHPDNPAYERVVDRRGWIAANTRLAARVLDRVDPDDRRPGLTEKVRARAAGAQVGAIFAVLGSKVLGQFDPFTDAPGPGTLYLVAPNVLEIERRLGVDAADFRLWVCLHEQTHRLQFGVAPWLVDHLVALMGQTLLADDGDWGLVAAVKEALSSAPDQAGRSFDVERLVRSPAARDSFDAATAVMSLLEGHADVMMDLAGTAAIPSMVAIRGRFEQRRDQVLIGSRVGRLIGLGAKIAQYRDGAAFCRAVIDRVGVDGLNAVWAGPQHLPSRAEIHEPDAWLRRVHG